MTIDGAVAPRAFAPKERAHDFVTAEYPSRDAGQIKKLQFRRSQIRDSSIAVPQLSAARVRRQAGE